MHLGQIAAEQPAKAAVIMVGTGERVTFAQLNAAANKLAHVRREHLAGYKCPRSVDFRAELPRHPAGKLLKRVLRGEYTAAFAQTEQEISR
jgi:acyl-CoA synthetase (AMP-forming)/AMP-acid ligase II